MREEGTREEYAAEIGRCPSRTNFLEHSFGSESATRYHAPMRRAVCISILLLAPACSVSDAVGKLQADSPPAELGRPGWVRTSAGTGAWLGGVVGLAASVVLLPITYPLSLLSDEPLGMAKQEFLWFPTYFGAATGHFLLGVPTDFLDFTFYRAWAGTPSPAERDYGFTPMKPPVGPSAEPPRGDETTGTGEIKKADPDDRPL